MMIQLNIEGKTVTEEIPNAVYGTIDSYYYKRKNNHSNHTCHYGLCNNRYCGCCGESWKNKK